MLTKNEVQKIIIGLSLDADGSLKPIGRNALNLADEIRAQVSLPVVLWDEHGSTRKAKMTRIEI